MNVLFQMRSDYEKNLAGDSIQMLSTAEELRKLGVKVIISTRHDTNLKGFDLVHLFGLTKISETILYFNNAKRQNKKVIVSPIYWDMHPFINGAKLGSGKLNAWNTTNHFRSKLINQCDLLLPNGMTEAALIKEQFLTITPIKVVPNGFPDAFISADPSVFRKHYPNLPQTFILSVARISPRKNQKWLAGICQDLDLPLVLAGPVNDQGYFKSVTNYRNVSYLGILSGELLASAYAAAKVHALPSWFETPGLSSLEAAACGTVVLTTDQGSVRDYFKDMAVYVHPKDDTSLIAGLLQACDWNSTPLTDYVRANFPWSKVGKLTLDAYFDLL